MFADKLAHNKRDLVRGVEFPGLFICICSELFNEVLVDEAEDVAPLLSIGWNILN